ncbi:hypothetical protein FACS1894104_3790 [Actinomycetota bacterium]|nr:hypothetical protein FACS1894104_3790 [Actinomycetota bacterium]
MVSASTVVVVAPQAYAAPLPSTLTITVTKDSSQSVQSIAPLSIDFDNAAGFGTAVKVSTTKSDLAQSQASISAPTALMDNTVGFALAANPTATPANLIPNGFAPSYPTADSATGLTLLFAGIDATAGAPIFQNEVAGQGTANFYLSAKVSPTLAAGDYHVTLVVETAATTTTSVTGTITWNDSSNADGIRPSTVDIKLFKSVGGGTPTQVTATPNITTTTTDTWTYSFTNLPEFESGLPVVYSVEGGTVSGYTISQTGNDLTYSHTSGTAILMAEPNLGGLNFLNTGIARSAITSIIFANTLPTGVTLTDVSAAGDGSVLASWNGSGTMTIGAAGGVIANPDCAGLFYELNFTTLDLTYFSTPLTTNMMAMFIETTLPAGLTFPAGFGSQATDMSYMFSDVTLPAGLTFPAGFGSQASSMDHMFGNAVLSTLTSFPAGFGSEATSMSYMFDLATLPAGLTFPTDFGSGTDIMSYMFYGATLPASLTFPADFGSKATDMSYMFSDVTLPTGFTLPTSFGTAATDMSYMFSGATLPTGFTLPTSFGTAATDMSFMFVNTTLPAGLTFPAGFGSAADDIDSMFHSATLQGNVDWSQTTSFTNLSTLNVNNMFQYTNFDSYTLKAGSPAIQAKFTDPSTGISSPSSIVL